MNADPVALISMPDDVMSWYRCGACGLRQRHRRALPSGGANCAACGTTIRSSDRFSYARPMTRLIAGGLDLVVLGVLLVTVAAIAGFGSFALPTTEDGSVTPEAQRWVTAIWLSGIAVYFILGSIACATAGTWGTGIRIVDARTWRRPSLARGVWRSLAIALTIATLGIGYFAMLWDDERRTLHDRIAGTRVIER